MLKLMGKKIFTVLRSKIVLIYNDIEVDGRHGPGRPKMMWMKLTRE